MLQTGATPSDSRPSRSGLAAALVAAAALMAVHAVLLGGGHILAGQIGAAVLLFFLVVAAGASRFGAPDGPDAAALRALALAAVIPVAAAGMPLGGRSTAVSLLLVGIPVGVAAVVLAPAVGIRRTGLVRPAGVGVHTGVVLAGVAFGLVAYLAGAPALGTDGPGRLGGAVAAAAIAGAVDELVFRGIVQTALQRRIGRIGVVLATALYASTLLGSGPAVLTLTLVLAAVVFAWSVVRTGSLLGAIAGHAALAVTATVAAPALLGSQPPFRLDGAAAAGTVGALLALGAVALLHSRTAKPPAAVVAAGARE